MSSLEARRAQVSELLGQGRELLARLKLRQCAEVGLAPIIIGTVWIHGTGTVRIGNRVRFNASVAPIELHTFEGAELCIGDDVCMNSGTSIEAHRSILIGDGVVLDAFSKIIDNHFHAVRGDRHRRPASTPVVIGAGAVIGRRATVLPGAQVAPGTVVRSGTLVRATSHNPSLRALLEA